MSKRSKREDKSELTPEEKQQKRRKDFLEHLGAFLIVNLMLFLINITTDPHDLWFQWVLLFWGVGLAFDAWDVFITHGDSGRQVVDRLARNDADTDTPWRRSTPESAPPPTGDEVSRILKEGFALIDRMRADARVIPAAEPRREALAACSASENVLNALQEHPHETALARDFLSRFLEPGSAVIRDYARLARRDIPSARETIRAVETDDLPQLTRQANAMYDRMHRGTLIDLETVREMMSFDAPALPSVKAMEDHSS